MTETRNCPQCGAALPDDSPSGLCPRCLLKQGFESQPAEGLAETAAPASRFTAPPPADLARHFPQLEVLELLGQGGMGAVYKARQPTLDRLVAVKILPAEVGRDPAFAERFTREARALARLGHPNIVGIYDFGQVDGLYYFIMEYVDGVSLRQLVEQRRLSPSQALALVPQICEALQFAHDEGIVHRDVKPENILLDKRGRVKIADFGLAKLLGRSAEEATLTRVEQVMGTPLYMAPEQMQGSHAVDHRADIYSLGVVFYEMLTGELPVGRFAPPSQKVHVDVRLDEVVLRTLEREPERRYQHASDVKTEVESIVASPASGAGVPSKDAAFTAPAPCPAQVRAPAIGLLITGIFNWVWMPTAGAAIAYVYATSPRTEWWHVKGSVLALAGIVILVLSACIMMAALKMMRCQAYPLAIAGSVLAMLVSPGNVIGLPIGIWALVVLLQREVKAAFAHSRNGGAPRSADASDEELVVRALRRSKNKIQAIGLYRDLTGAGLAAAKTAVEAIAKKHEIELKSLTQRDRALQIAVASLVLIAVAYFLSEAALSEHLKIVFLIGASALYVAFVAAHGIGARRDRIRHRRIPPEDAAPSSEANMAIRRFGPAIANTHAWVVLLGLSGVASGLLPWGKITWYGPDPAGDPGAASRWNEILLYGWQSWQGKAAMAVFLVLALLRLASGFSTRPRRWQAASLLVGVVAILALCYPNPPPQLPDFLVNLLRVELHLGLAVPVALAMALLIVAAVEWRVAQDDGSQRLPLAALFAPWMRSRRTLRALQWGLVLIVAVCFLVFFSFRTAGRHDSQGHWQSSYAVGLATPWFLFETWPAPNMPFRWNFLLNSSWLFSVLAFAACYAAWRIEKTLRPEAGFWSGSPRFLVVVWCFCVIFVTAYGMAMGFRSVDERVGDAPAVRSTVSPTDDRATVNRKTEETADSSEDSSAASQAREATIDAPREAPPASSSSPFLAAAERGQIGEIKKLLNEGADINDKDANGETALMKAASHDHASLAQALLSLGASETERDRAGETALMKAAAEGHVECARAMLLDRLGPVAVRDKQGRTALAHAVLNRRTDFLRAMTEMSNVAVGILETNFKTNSFLDPRDVPWMNDDGKTILDESRERGFDEIADLLRRYVEERIDLDTKYLGIAKGGHWRFYLHRGRCFEALGERAKAEADFQECRRLLDQDLPGYRPEGVPP